MKIFYRSLLISIFAIVAASPLSVYAPPLCKLHNSRFCNTAENFIREDGQGCASIDGNCRKVFCQQCVELKAEALKEGETMNQKMVNTCGFECLYPEVLIRYPAPEENQRNLNQRNLIYDLAAEAYQNLRMKGRAPISTKELQVVRAAIGAFFESRVEELARYRANSLTYSIKNSVEQMVNTQVKQGLVFVDQVKSTAFNAINTAQRTANDGVNQFQQGVTQISQQAVNQANQTLQRVSRASDQLNSRLNNLSQKIEDAPPQALTQNRAKLSRQLEQEITKVDELEAALDEEEEQVPEVNPRQRSILRKKLNKQRIYFSNLRDQLNRSVTRARKH